MNTPVALSPQKEAEVNRQLAILSANTVQIVPEEGLRKKLIKSIDDAGKVTKPLRIKFGMDPTAPDIHLGHTVVLKKLREFQDLGHIAIPLIGDYTTLIGDPSGRNKTRPPLTPEDIKSNAATYFEQAFKVISDNPDVLEMHENSEWLGKLTFADTIKMCAQVTVAQIIQREDFATRLDNNTPISMHELLYPIMQGQDSVALNADIELGGTDQTFNCLMGRQLMHSKGMEEQIVMTFPLIEGLDGTEKMSKSKDNYVGVTDTPNDMFGKLMSAPDALLEKYRTLLTTIPAEEMPEHPMKAKKAIASFIVTQFHSAEAATAAQQDFETRFSKKEVPDDLPEFEVNDAEIGLAQLIVKVGFAPSNNEARRLIKQGAVKLDGTTVNDTDHNVQKQPAPLILQAGRRRIGQINFV